MKSKDINMGDIIKFTKVSRIPNETGIKYAKVIRIMKIVDSIEIEEKNTFAYQAHACDEYDNANYYLGGSEILEVYKKEENFNPKKDKK